MKFPWTEHEGLAKVVAISATVLSVSLGLCGLNFLLVIDGKSFGDILMFTGWVELAGIALGLCGFLYAGIQYLVNLFRKDR